MKTGKKIAVLSAVFLIAAVVYFMWPMGRTEESGEQITYSAMEEATLPLVYPKMGEIMLAPLLGHREERAVTAERNSLLVLPEDRRLDVVVAEAKEVMSLGYEIRSLDAEHLIERTELKDWKLEDGKISVTLPIQNLIDKETEYQLGIRIGLKNGSEAWYYSRITETDSAHAMDMLALASEFSQKTFHYDSAQDLTMYMETSPSADNGSFGVVTLKNNFNQMTWGTMGIERSSEPRIMLKELDGDVANVELKYEVSRTDEVTGIETFTVTENFTMKWTSQRIYMMDYERRMNEVFTGDRNCFSGKRILLGISDGDGQYVVKSADGRFVTFVNNRELWSYDTKEGTVALVFSFADTDEGRTLDVRAYEDRHGIEILQVEDNGDIDFLVYGYMNRGVHEGWTGVSYHSYRAGDNSLEEQFFLPVSEPYEELADDIRQLAFVGENGNLYLYMKDSIYGIDMTSHEYVVVASGLNRECFAVSVNSSRIAWQENTGLYDSKILHIMDLNTGNKTQIGDGKSDSYRILGFVGNDCVYGIGNSGDYIMAGDRVMGLYLKSLEIVDESMETAMYYEKNGYYIRNVVVDESRIHITRVRDRVNGFFEGISEDTLVCNVETMPKKTDEIGWYASNVKGRIYFVQLEKEIVANQKIKRVSPKKLVSGEDRVLSLDNGGFAGSDVTEFYAYGRGRCLGMFTDFSEAAQTAYENMGFVSVGANMPIWSRINKPGAYFMRDVQNAVKQFEQKRELFTGMSHGYEEGLALDASGTALNQILYFVGQNQLVLVNTGYGRYQYLTGYDQGHVRIWDPMSEQSETIALETAKERFEKAGNDFICFISEK